MVSQLLFGDVVTLEDETQYWQKVNVKLDGYEGWCTASHLHILQKNQMIPNAAFTGEWVNRMYVNNMLMYLPFGCDISLFLHASPFDSKNIFRYDGSTLALDRQQSTEEHIAYISKFFLNTAYLWGGKSVFGIDCSGFSQLVFRMAGQRILRDAWQQAEQGDAVAFENVKMGDLAFFTNDEGRVVHVGILLEHSRIIHAAGKVRIDHLSREGIINVDTGEKSHSLSAIKRYF
jgi:hypothetical protein